MSQSQADVTAARLVFMAKLRNWLERGRQRLYAYRPRLRDRRFWVVLALVVTIAIIHDIVEATGAFHDVGLPYFVPISMFLVPVIYAALNFGFVGAVATALLAAIITAPNFILWHHGLERFGVIFQTLIVVAVAYFLGSRVDREKSALQRAEAAATALKASNIKYRGLLDSSPVAILVMDQSGVVMEANPAASTLFGRDRATLESMHIADLVGKTGAQKLLASQNGRQPDYLTLKLKDGTEFHLEPTLTHTSDGQGNFVIQVLLRDITKEHHRRTGLKAYAAYVMRANEEERQRIARELHDDTIQSLVLLCRQLDSAELEGGSGSSSLRGKLQKARADTEEVITQLRNFTKNLRPPILDDLGIVPSINRQLTEFIERTNAKGKLKVVGAKRRLPPEIELSIFRIAQEALRNVEHHAGATRVTVTITFAEGETRLDVVDNGVGFPTPPDSGKLAGSGHLGLISMHERAELIGGSLEIHSTPGKGTRVTLLFPVAGNYDSGTSQHIRQDNPSFKT